MRFERNRRRKVAAFGGQPAGGAPSGDVAAVLDRARAAMGNIVADARTFRLQSDERLRTISDRSLRGSVGMKFGRSAVQPAAASPVVGSGTQVGMSTPASTRAPEAL